MAKKQDAATAIDADTRAMLEGDVKKKKPRKFLLIYKGAQIKTLVVFKKGPFGPRVMKAKKAGHLGDLCCGIAVGSGEKLALTVPANAEVAAAMKVDAFLSDPPVETEKLKKFFKDNGLRFKPRFEMVLDAAEVRDPDQDELATAAEAAPAADVSSPTEAAAPSPEEATRFKQRLTELLSALSAQGTTPGADEAKRLAAEAAGRGKQGEFAAGHALLDEAEEALAAAAPAPGEATPATTAATVTDEQRVWNERAAGLLGGLQDLQRAGVDLTEHANLTKFVKAATQFGKQGSYDKAHRVAGEAERLITELQRGARQNDAQATIAKGFVRRQIYLRERWRQLPLEIDTKLMALRPRVGRDLIAAAGDALRQFIADIDERIQDSVDQGGRDFAAVVSELNQARQQVQADPLIQHLDAHPSVDEIGVRATFLTALDDLEQMLTA